MLLAFGLALVAAVIDLQTQTTLGKLYQGAYVLGCVGAICLVRRANLFGPMVQPPLVFAVTAVGTVLTMGPDAPGEGLKSVLFSVALPLTSNFPTMGITTAVVVAIGVGRLFLQRDPGATDEDDAPRPAVARRPRPEPSRDDEDLFAAPPRRRPARDEEAGRPPRRPARDDRARAPREDAPRSGRPTRDERKPARPTADKPARDARDDRPRRPVRDEAAGRPRPPREDPRARGTRDPNRARDTGKPREAQPDRKPPRPDPNRQPPRRPRPTER
ncbi:hypothetical protein SAMN05192558_10894 [Actinokineospora alba]|uniref:DUF6542 domain-containing protein n=1 Tax=Actinokineospora alba TaxID=504798 RepID=A0A1H0RRY2_9PSEU|nr:hypothetical protein C8E96_2466 [Actinokineospora alba]SDJ33403.1 hypothetical protein SAMN05421871_11394 [Actinokineospora alba]SDP32119.1 hypothetical protein SAMN05192558_10894 [Actinokineospora alba]